jgi:hypothetical protein
MTDYERFLDVLGALSQLVVLSMILERGLAFVFEHEWFTRLTCITVPDPTDPARTVQKSRIPGLKGLIALLSAVGICHYYAFDVLAALFGRDAADGLGMTITGVVAAGGSAGAIAIFQGFLNFNKEARDALVAAKKAESEAARERAELSRAAAGAERAQAEAVRGRAELNLAAVQAEAAAVRAEAEAKQAGGR